MAFMRFPAREPVAGRRATVHLSSFWRSFLGITTVILALLSAMATFLVLANFVPVVPTRDVVITLFTVNGLLIGVLLIVIGFEASRLIVARRRGQAAAALHVRIVGLFAFVATAPAILVAVVGWLTLERGIDVSFSGQIKELLQTSVGVARAYQEFQCRSIGREVRLMASDLGRARPVYDENRDVFREFMRSRSYFLGFFVAILMSENSNIVERIDNVDLPDLALPKEEDFAAANESTDGICLFQENSNIFRALVKVPGFDAEYLLVARTIDPKALQFPQQAELAARYYDALAEQKLGVQIAFASMYALISVILLLSAVWVGLSFANWLVAPISRLIFATDQVASGNYTVRVPVTTREGDLAHLSDTFNKMTEELGRQTNDLQKANVIMDKRRRFTEAVLSGVSAGVIGLDEEGKVTLLNPSAEQLLDRDLFSLEGKRLVDEIPAFKEILPEDFVDRGRSVQGQISIGTAERERTLTVRVTIEQESEEGAGVIVTLDDITDLVTAQRTSAWADVARRIAHEIKNPLTPIQLSAERIRRKYGKVILDDREVFDQCTDTIIRQVDDIKRMVDEFSSFARMPKPLLDREDVVTVIRQVLFLMRVGHPEIEFSEHIPQSQVITDFDRRLIAQALTNIVKNATEAIAAVPIEERGKAKIDVALTFEKPGMVAIDIIDNGKGFPTEARQRLLEPYMTTRAGGTGLGLAIVGKILEEHGGGVELLDRPDGQRGACVRLFFPLDQTQTGPRAA